MSGLLYTIIFLAPLAILVSGLHRRTRWSLLVAALPPLVASLLLPVGQAITLDWFLLGSRVGTGTVTQWLLPATALVWVAAAIHHALDVRPDPHAPRFRLFFLLTLCGNLVLLLSQDVITFYVGYALMGLAGYGMVQHRRSINARVAAGTYLRWTIAGELMLFSGLLSLAHDVGSTHLPLTPDVTVSAWTLALLIGGLGIKIGLPGLHAWMPGTYSAASTSGSAVFSGAMANAGILGLLHFLPLQQDGYNTAGFLLLVFGLLGAFYGVLLGLPQRRPKVILAYSSMSQLGTLAAMIGLALQAPELAPALIVGITVYAVHHGLTKAALFLALDSIEPARWRSLGIALLVALSLMMAGLPFTSGAVAKSLIKEGIDSYAWLATVLAIGGIGTTLLMTRFLFACQTTSRKAMQGPAWAGAAMALLLAVAAHFAVYQVTPLPALSMHAIWPLAIGIVLVIAFSMLPPRARSALQPAIPKGDIPNLLAKAVQRLVRRYPLLPTLKTLRDRLTQWHFSENRPSAQSGTEDSTNGVSRSP